MFIDTAKIKVKAGKGGNGVNSLYQDRLTMKGHPDGGDGGKGGDIIMRVSTNVHTLLDFQYRHTFKAENGAHGSGKKKKGKGGKDIKVDVPQGMLIYDADTKQLLKDLTTNGEEFIVARGGVGGRGNRSHKDATNGGEGEEKNLVLELKTIAEVGIIGFPNVGKSTLISSISKARPRIANFPFTTKSPILGIVEYHDSLFSIVEIPGLIKDSHKGKGLGDKFLRHAERVKLFIHLLDLSDTTRDAYSDYINLNKELELYGKDLACKPQIIVGNKIDIEGATEGLDNFKKKSDKNIIAISAKENIGLDGLVEITANTLKTVRDSHE